MWVKMKRNLLAGLLLLITIQLTGCSSPNEEKDGAGGNADQVTVEPTKTDTIPSEGETDKSDFEALEWPKETEAVIPKDGIAFSRTNYFYAESVEVEILTDKSGAIYYTLDGTDPDQTAQKYTEAILLEAKASMQATVFKAKAFFEDGSESDIITHTYFVGQDMKDRFDTLVFSVTTDPYNLYDYEYGIFVEGKLRDDFIAANPNVEVVPSDPANFNMRGRESEREVYLEAFLPNGEQIIGQAAGIRTYGGWSRAREQKSIKLFARKEYDEENNKFRYEFFPEKTSADGKGNELDSFKQLVLRNCGNDNGFAFIRDELFQTLAGQAGYQDYEAVKPAALFVNGEYRGFFWLHEVYGDEYFEDHYGDYTGSFEILEGGELFKEKDADGENLKAVEEYESLYNTYSNMDLTIESNYQELNKVFDVQNYLEYYALQVYIGNEDWPHNNYRTYRYYAKEGEAYGEGPFDGKWRFLLHDLDYSFGIYGEAATQNNLGRFMGINGDLRDACPLFGQLMRREDCRDIFIKKTLDLLNGAFSKDNLSTVLDEMNTARFNELSHTYDKSLLEDWVSPLDLPAKIEAIKEYANIRSKFILNTLRSFYNLGEPYNLSVKAVDECEVKVNSYQTAKDFNGTYYPDIDTQMKAIVPKGSKFDHWLVNGQIIENEILIIDSSMIVEGNVEVSFEVK